VSVFLSRAASVDVRRGVLSGLSVVDDDDRDVASGGRRSRRSGRRLVVGTLVSGASDRSSKVFCDTNESNAPPCDESGGVDEERDGAGGNGTAPVVEDTDR
jgi:hypothetical protein